MPLKSKYFKESDVVFSKTALDKGILNVPSAQNWENAQKLVEELDKIRKELGSPLIVNSWFRCPELNKAVRGSSTSDHMQGCAVDLRSNEFPSMILAKYIAEICEDLGIIYDQIIYEQTWVHLSISPKKRGQKLTYKAGQYVQGFHL